MTKTLSDPETECLKIKKEINENHRLAQKAAGDAVERAVLTGELLMQWKDLLPHGKFEGFVETHFEGSLRTAQLYMQSAKRLAECSKAQRIALLKSELSITGLLEFPKNGAARPGISVKGKPGGEQTPSSTPTPVSPGPASGEAAVSSNGSGKNGSAQVDYGKCPNCAGTKWTEDEFGAICAKCQQPHGEPVGGVDEDRVDTQRSKTIKTVEALMRAFDDLNMLQAKPDHPDAIAQCKFLLTIARNWK